MSVYENIPDNVTTTNLKENLQYVDKDDYAFTIEIKNKKIHQMVYSILMIIFLVITYYLVMIQLLIMQILITTIVLIFLIFF